MSATPLLDAVAERERREKNDALWGRHKRAADAAKAAGACWQCAAEVGCRATDEPGEERERFKLHLGCLKSLSLRGVYA